VIICSSIILILSNVIAADQINTGGPRVVTEGNDALLTCVVMGPYRNDTVLWRKGPTEIIAAGLNRVTNDKRISVLHDDAPSNPNKPGGDVWVLLIKMVKPEDTDVYVCEVNSDPVIRSFHPLHIKSKDGKFYSHPSVTKDKKTRDPTELSPPKIDNDSEYHNFPPTITHDFTDCCESFNVSTKCLGFCTIHNILDGTTGVEPEACENDFPSIIKCMADGRNHMPCCEKKMIPDLCQDMCRGEYTPFSDLLKSRISCAVMNCLSFKLKQFFCILAFLLSFPHFSNFSLIIITKTLSIINIRLTQSLALNAFSKVFKKSPANPLPSTSNHPTKNLCKFHGRRQKTSPTP
jgi:DB module